MNTPGSRQSRAADANTPEVFVYYANENSPDAAESENYTVISDWLTSSETPEASRIADSLASDRVEFPRVVDEEIADLRRHIPAAGDQLRAVIFTNRLVRTGRYLILQPGANEFREAAIEVPVHENYILNSNPLSQPEVFHLVLAEVAGQFDPASHNFILLTKSHGNFEKAMLPRLVVRNEETDRDEILTVAAGETAADRQPGWGAGIGITKDDYFSVLADADRDHGMQFSLVVMESCKGDINDELTQQLPPNVDRLYNSGPRSAEYSNLDYADLLPRCDENHPLAGLLAESLADRFQTLHHERKPFPYHVLLLFLPLLLWLGWIRLRRRRTPRVTGNPADS